MLDYKMTELWETELWDTGGLVGVQCCWGEEQAREMGPTCAQGDAQTLSGRVGPERLARYAAGVSCDAVAGTPARLGWPCRPRGRPGTARRERHRGRALRTARGRRGAVAPRQDGQGGAALGRLAARVAA